MRRPKRARSRTGERAYRAILGQVASSEECFAIQKRSRGVARQVRKVLRKKLEQSDSREKEDRLVRLLNAYMPERHDWFLQARHASLREDVHLGIDVIVDTIDVGELPIQVRSSQEGLERFYASDPKKRQGVIGIIVRRKRKDSAIVNEIAQQLHIQHKHRLVRRGS